MKQLVSIFVLLICLLGLIGCQSDKKQLNSSVPITENQQSTETKESNIKNNWTEQEITSMFIKTMDDSCNIIDCVLIPDYAYDRVGAVLYWDGKKETTNVAFIDADGYNQSCGIYEKTYSQADFTYLGNGEVAFVLQSEEGEIYNCNITLSIDGSNVNFTVEDDLLRG